MHSIINGITKADFAIAFIFALAFIGIAFPYGLPLFFPVVFIYFFVSLVQDRVSFQPTFGVVILTGCVLFYLFGVLMSGGVIYNHVKIDLFNMASALLLMPILLATRKSDWLGFARYFNVIICGTSAIVSAFSLYKFYMLLNGTKLDFIEISNGEHYPWGTSLVADYNMFAFALFAGMIATINCLRSTRSVFIKYFCFLILALLVVSVVLSGSRRAWITLLLGLGALVVMGIRSVMVKSRGNLDPKAMMRNLAAGALGLITMTGVGLQFGLFDHIKLDLNTSNNQAIEALLFRFSTISGETATISESFSSRTELWEFAVDEVGDQNIVETMVGTGFTYLETYGKILHQDEAYPHNPLISTIHYSGLLGCLLVVAVVLLALRNVYVQREIFASTLLPLFIIAIAFLLPSANTIFSVKAFLLIILIGLALPRRSDELAPIEGGRVECNERGSLPETVRL